MEAVLAAEGAGDVRESAALAWTLSEAPLFPTTFRVDIGPAPDALQALVMGFDAMTIAVEDLLPETTYYWQVTAENAYGETPGSVWSFSTAGCVESPVSSPAPADAAVDIGMQPSLSWSVPVDLYCDTAPVFDVYFGDSPATLARIAINLEAAHWDQLALAPGHAYYWRISMRTCCGVLESPVWSFVTAACAPEVPGGPSPADGAVGQALNTALEWQAPEDAFCGATDRFDVYLGRVSETPAPVSLDQEGTRFEPGTLLPEQSYVWYVVRKTCCGDLTSPVWTFTTGMVEEHYTEVFGASGGDLAFSSVRFTLLDGGYETCYRSAMSFPIPTTSSVTLGDDDFLRVDLSHAVRVLDAESSTVYISSNGMISFTEPPAGYSAALEDHFARPGVSAYLTDLDPRAGGSISYRAMFDRFVVTYSAVPAYGSDQTVSSQVELFFSGDIRITWLTLGSVPGVVGLSAGTGVPAAFVPSDFSAYTVCPDPGGEGEEDGIHSADQDGDYVIGLSELLRICQFFNSDGFHCEDGTEDDFAPGPGDTWCKSHDSDYNPQDWHVDLSELLRMCQFFNYGGYHYCPDLATEDGFCPGP